MKAPNDGQALDVYLFGAHAGTLRDAVEDGGLTFTYGERALDEPARMRLSVRLPVRPQAYGPHDTAPFFDNLLPEGNAREVLARTVRRDVGDTYALLGQVGGECADAAREAVFDAIGDQFGDAAVIDAGRAAVARRTEAVRGVLKRKA